MRFRPTTPFARSLFSPGLIAIWTVLSTLIMVYGIDVIVRAGEGHPPSFIGVICALCTVVLLYPVLHDLVVFYTHLSDEQVCQRLILEDWKIGEALFASLTIYSILSLLGTGYRVWRKLRLQKS